MNATNIELTGYIPGALGRMTELHGIYYAAHWGLGLDFEARIATDLASFFTRFDPARDGVWFARANDQIVGGLLIDGADAQIAILGAKLRFFIVDPAYQGQGIGNRLLSEAITFCKDRGYKRVYLSTVAGLNAARHLYEKVGFRLSDEKNSSHLTGKIPLIDQEFEMFLP
jgi:GNAT superfamily N-acetyltransferase